jgi:hypothetical protein
MKGASLIAVLLVFAFVGCRGKSKGSPSITLVNGCEVSRTDFNRFVTLKLGEFATPEMSDSLCSQIFNEYLLRHVLIDEATHLGLTITNTKVKKIAQDIP